MVRQLEKFKFYQFFKLNFFALLSGLMMGTSYIPFPPWAFFLCWVPLWWDLLRKPHTLQEVFKKAWLSQFVLTMIGFHWIAFVSHEFGYMPWPVAVLVLLLFAATVHLYIPIACALALLLGKRFHLRQTSTLFLLPVFMALGEIYWPSLFPWNLGYTMLWIRSPIAQVADSIGFQGLSFIFFILNSIVVVAIMKPQKMYRLACASVIISTLAVLHFVGLAKQKTWQEMNAEVRVLQIQANIGNLEKMQAQLGNGFQQEIARQYFDLTNKALQEHPNAEFILWPEAAFPVYLDLADLNANFALQFRQFVQQANRPILTGGFSHSIIWQGAKVRSQDYNAVFAFDQAGQPIGAPYHKTKLLAFGEFMPFEEEFPFLAKINPNGGSFGRGTGPTIMNLPLANLLRVGVQICYESLDPDFTRELARRGADLLVNVTNDSWFGPRFEPEQHMIMTLARAIEVRRPLVRATNTGITTAILADGTRLQESPIGMPWYDIFDIHFRSQAPMTFFTRFGNFLPFVIFALGLLIVLFDFATKGDQGHAKPTITKPS